MAWTTPGTAVAGDVLTAAFWNEQVRDNFNNHENRFKQYAYVSRENYGGGQTFGSTTFAGANELFASDATWTADGSSYIVEFFIPLVFTTGATQGAFRLSNGSTTELGYIGYVALAANTGCSVFGRYLYTPASGSVSLNVRPTTNSANAITIYASDGGAGDYLPSYLRVIGAG